MLLCCVVLCCLLCCLIRTLFRYECNQPVLTDANERERVDEQLREEKSIAKINIVGCEKELYGHIHLLYIYTCLHV